MGCCGERTPPRPKLWHSMTYICTRVEVPTGRVFPTTSSFQSSCLCTELLPCPGGRWVAFVAEQQQLPVRQLSMQIKKKVHNFLRSQSHVPQQTGNRCGKVMGNLAFLFLSSKKREINPRQPVKCCHCMHILFLLAKLNKPHLASIWHGKQKRPQKTANLAVICVTLRGLAGSTPFKSSCYEASWHWRSHWLVVIRRVTGVPHS